jgi:hypothetical protein
MRKDYVNLMGNLLEFHNAKVISMSVYSDLDAMDEGKFFARIPSILNQLKIWLLEQRNSGHQGTNQS